MKKIFAKLRQRLALTIAILIVFLGIAIYAVTKQNDGVSLVAVSRGTVIQEVIATGKTKPAEDVDLAFEKSGKIVAAYVKTGDQVKAGDPLAATDRSELDASLLEAQANVLAQEASLGELKRGTRPEDIQVKQTELQEAQQTLTNEYGGVVDTLNDAYSKADDAVRKQIDPLFTNDELANPQLTFSVYSSQTEIDVETGRLQARAELNAWQNELTVLGNSASQATLDAALTHAKTHLNFVYGFLNRTMDAVVGAIGLSDTTTETYKTNVNTARTNVNTALANVNTKEQVISSDALAVERVRNELALKLAGSTPEAIEAQEAQVKQAEAKVAGIEAQIAKTTLRSPITGVVTKQDAKVGEIVAANTSVVSVISQNNLEIEVNVPEIDIGKMAVGNPVAITVDAFPGETFSGNVTHIDPAETIVDGVVNFKVTVFFDKPDPRMKSGLTANLRIETMKREGILTLPQFTITENTGGAFVRKDNNGAIVETPVVLGIRGQDGLVEILSGLSEGDKVAGVEK